MTDNAIIVTVDSVRSRASTQETLLTLAVPQEYAPMVAKFLGMIHKPVAVAFAEVEQDGTPKHEPKKSAEKETKPYGKEAAELYRTGFFFNPKVLEAIGTDEEFLGWVRAQPCAVTGKFDYTKDEATGETLERCEAAHVRRIANGSGVAEKPPYSAIPLTHRWHDLQTCEGEKVFDMDDPKGDPRKGREWMDKQRAHYVHKWASAKLATTLGYTSMGHVPPDTLRAWARERDLDFCLPECYRRVFTSQQAD